MEGGRVMVREREKDRVTEREGLIDGERDRWYDFSQNFEDTVGR